tara:strand:- start:19621 stop:19947 length:327 start_codon:yes stop_codon:yes gene_type:complete
MEKVTLNSILLSTAFVAIFSAGALGSFGAIVQYLYQVINEEIEYKLSFIISYILMGFFTGVLAYELMLGFLGESYPGIVLISGFIFMKILAFLQEIKLPDLVRVLTKK